MEDASPSSNMNSNKKYIWASTAPGEYSKVLKGFDDLFERLVHEVVDARNSNTITEADIQAARKLLYLPEKPRKWTVLSRILTKVLLFVGAGTFGYGFSIVEWDSVKTLLVVSGISLAILSAIVEELLPKR